MINRPNTATGTANLALATAGANKNPLIPRGPNTFTERDLFKAMNMYTILDKNQHLMNNKLFA